MVTEGPKTPAIQRKRYHRIIVFAAGVFGQTVWWDVILAFPLLGIFAPRPSSAGRPSPAAIAISPPTWGAS